MPTLAENYELVKDMPQARYYTAILTSGGDTFRLCKPSMAELEAATNMLVKDFKMHVVAVHSL